MLVRSRGRGGDVEGLLCWNGLLGRMTMLNIDGVYTLLLHISN